MATEKQAMNFECPQCKEPISQDGQKFCNRCGADLRTFYASKGITAVDSDMSEEETLTMDVESLKAAEPPTFNRTVIMGGPDITLDTTPPDAAAKRKATLRIVLPSSDVFDRELKKVETQIGKSPRNDIVIADPAVSSSHAVIRTENNGYTITDLGSRNGTSVNGKRITEVHRLRHGDVIGMGVTRLTFRMSGHSETGIIQTAEVNASTEPIAVALPLNEDSLATALVSQGLLSADAVAKWRGADGKGRRLYRAVIDEKLLGEEKLRDFMSRIFQIQTVNLRETKIDETVASGFSAKLARQFHLLPIAETPWQITIVVADPTVTETVEEVKQKTDLQPELRLATFSEITEQINKFYAAKLVGVLPDGRTLEYAVEGVEVAIGKAPHNQIILTDATVSNSHAVLLSRDGGFTIVDLGSRNGTFVNGERLSTHAHTLKHGDSIQMGKTVLTFRNPAETPENITAVLSAEALEEVRRRAGIATVTAAPNQTAAPAEIATVAVNGGETVQPAPAVVAPAAVPEEDDKKKKKEDKKDKENRERIKAAYIRAIGTILATVISALVTVLITLSIMRSATPPPAPPPSENTNTAAGKDKTKVKVATPGAGIQFAGNMVYEASGVVQVPNSEGVYFVVDNRRDQIFYMRLDENGKQSGDIKVITTGAEAADPESISYNNSFMYVMSSLSKDGDKNALLRFPFDANTQTITGKVEVIRDIRQFLIANVPELKAVEERGMDEGGVNVQGLAWDASNDRWLLGLRAPLVNGKAMVIPLKLKNPQGEFASSNLTIPEPPILLSLGGLGIRDMQYDTRTATFLMIAGDATSGGTSGYVFYEWNGSADQSKPESNPVESKRLDATMKPEGIARIRVAGKEMIFIVGDGGSYLPIRIEGQ